ncbi:hypothetical protein NX801_28575 [Streptomyces sp. LP05-1]|uniref:Transcriptional regulator n=1 Tax=Streptomyces pyxinae TaxID=2970734 RepID=A0ABT2CPZ5_9ACTN|nr:hypothetical protein [Streptomyces sp. LP05-1]MCS0639520.1 hypothetical protein [Streptomyces sp. LP05-1]
MAPTVGVIGPHDLVDRVVALGARTAGTPRLLALPYAHETETAEAVARGRSVADALLFTGVVPYELASAAGVLDRPAMYVPYSGATLLRALVELLRLGHDVSRLSIDTLRREEVVETLTEAKLPTEHVRVLPYADGLTSRELVEFHRDARDRAGARVALTCLGSAFRVLEQETHAVRLAPSRHSVLATLRALVLATAGRDSGDAQLALGVLELPDRPDLPDVGGTGGGLGALGVLGGSLAELPDGRRLVVTTRGVLESVTGRFTRLPFLEALGARYGTAHLGFGLARTAAEAESLARRAVGRARTVGPVAGVVSLGHDVDLVIDPAAPGPGHPGAGGRAGDDPALLARRVGVRAATLERIRELADRHSADGLTAQLVAEHLSVQQRTARSLLKRMERAGVAVPSGSRQEAGRSGRPPIVYRVRL